MRLCYTSHNMGVKTNMYKMCIPCLIFILYGCEGRAPEPLEVNYISHYRVTQSNYVRMHK